jgi:hypothetical protein
VAISCFVVIPAEAGIQIFKLGYEKNWIPDKDIRE